MKRNKGCILTVPGMNPEIAVWLATGRSRVYVPGLPGGRDSAGILDHLERWGGAMFKRDLRRARRRFYGHYGGTCPRRWEAEYRKLLQAGGITESGTGTRHDPVLVFIDPGKVDPGKVTQVSLEQAEGLKNVSNNGLPVETESGR